MNRIASQFIYCAPDKILRNTVVERTDTKQLTGLFSLQDSRTETANTLFFDGIISAQILSVKLFLSPEDIMQQTANYHYVDVSDLTFCQPIIHSNVPLVIDFGTSSIEEINKIIRRINPYLKELSTKVFIGACVYYPGLILGKQNTLALNTQSDIILWQGMDLPNNLLGTNFQISQL